MKIKIAGWLFAAALAAVPLSMMTGCAVTSGRETVGQYTDDKTITAKVKTALAKDSVVKAHQVNVTTFQGVVQLSGFVDSQAQKDRATEIVRNMEGVKELHNDLVVATGRSSGDAGLKGEAEIKADDGKVKTEVDVDKK
jgi:hyperosmotically inducible periplasmic protein